MALNIEFDGFVNEIKTFDWGKVARVTHSQRAKNPATGAWETVGKDYLDVTLPQGSDVEEGARIKVVGTFKVKTYPKKDGTTGVSLQVRATEVTVGLLQGVPKSSAPFQAPSDWTPVTEDDGLPF